MSMLEIIKTDDKIPIAKPKIGVAGKTGIWRLQRPLIDLEKCNRCYICEIYCPVNVIRVEKEMVEINYDYCKGCGICADVCPQKAISMVKEEGET